MFAPLFNNSLAELVQPFIEAKWSAVRPYYTTKSDDENSLW